MELVCWQTCSCEAERSQQITFELFCCSQTKKQTNQHRQKQKNLYITDTLASTFTALIIKEKKISYQTISTVTHTEVVSPSLQH